MADKRKEHGIPKGMIGGAAGGAIAAAIASGGKVKSPRFALLAAAGAGLGAYFGPKIIAGIDEARDRPAPTVNPHPERAKSAPSMTFGDLDLSRIDGSTVAGAIGGAAAAAIATGGKVSSPKGAALMAGGAFLGALVAPALFGGEAAAAEAVAPAPVHPEFERSTAPEMDGDKLGRGMMLIGGGMAANEVMRISGIGNKTVGGRLGRYGAAFMAGGVISDMVFGDEAQAAEAAGSEPEEPGDNTAAIGAAFVAGSAAGGFGAAKLLTGAADRAMSAANDLRIHKATIANVESYASKAADIAGRRADMMLPNEVRGNARALGINGADSRPLADLGREVKSARMAEAAAGSRALDVGRVNSTAWSQRVRAAQQAGRPAPTGRVPFMLRGPGRIGAVATAAMAVGGSAAAIGAAAYLNDGAKDRAAIAPARAPARAQGASGGAQRGGASTYTKKDGSTVRVTAAQAAAYRARRK